MGLGYLVLSLFPGIDLFGEAYHREGFCVVRGPELFLGQDVREWQAIPSRFDVVIGGPPCKTFSHMRLGKEAKHENLIPEFCRVVGEARPLVFVMENIQYAPVPMVPGYQTVSYVLDSHKYGANQIRKRRFTFGWQSDGLDGCPFVPEKCVPRETRKTDPFPTVLACEGHYPATFTAGTKIGRMLTITEVAELQGVPELAEKYVLSRGKRAPFRLEFAYELLGNAVEMTVGRVVARMTLRGLESLAGSTSDKPPA